MSISIYPGSFDPVTLGHIDIIKRAAKMTDVLIVGVLKNSAKRGLFTIEEREDLLRQVTKDIPNIEIKSFDGLLVDFAKENNANTIVRGLRAITDFDYELQMAQTNRALYEGADTIFIPTSIEYSFLSSTTVREIASLGGDVSKFVAPYVEEKLKEKYNTK
ncbi:MAG: pantetheine-phosphate adenylyltransferase [Lachnospiraceae bacterium]|nr:pantetheine-phosphate adenylyltransferase [Lachnospiraceae bacterium]MBQ8412028.1 pantetheine-phosphate adenylyltransferase [Lachnospiraceae bacterium]